MSYKDGENYPNHENFMWIVEAEIILFILENNGFSLFLQPMIKAIYKAYLFIFSNSIQYA